MFRRQVEMNLKAFFIVRARVAEYAVVSADIGNCARMQCFELAPQ